MGMSGKKTGVDLAKHCYDKIAIKMGVLRQNNSYRAFKQRRVDGLAHARHRVREDRQVRNR